MFDPQQYTQNHWLRGGDLRPGEQLILTIAGGREHHFDESGSGDTRPVISFEETQQEMTINKTQMKTLVSLFGPDPRLWIGQRIAIMPVPSSFEGKPTIMILPAPGVVPSAKSAGIPAQPQLIDSDIPF